MAQPNYSINFWSPLSGSVASMTAGYVVCYDTTQESFTVATSAAIAAAGSAAGVAISDSTTTSPKTFALQSTGNIAASITGLGAGAAGPVVVTALGLLARKAIPVPGDFVMGDCDTHGNLTLTMGVSQTTGSPAGGDPPPTGTGVVRVNAGAFEAAGSIGGALQALRTNAGATDVEWYTPPGAPVTATVVTANDAPTVIANVPVPNDSTVMLTGTFAATKDDGTEGAAYVLRAAWRNDSGVLAQIGIDQKDFEHEDDAAWNVGTSDKGDGTVDVKVTGKAMTNINWTVALATVAAP